MKTILLAKKRGGGWVLLADPDVSHSTQVQMRRAYVGKTSEEFTLLMCCRADDLTCVFPAIKFTSAQEKKDAEETRQASETEWAKTQELSAAREKDRVAKLEADEKARHEAIVAKLNIENDAARLMSQKAA